MAETKVVETAAGRLVRTSDPAALLVELERAAGEGRTMFGSVVFAQGWFGSETLERGRLSLSPYAVRPDTGAGDRGRPAGEVLALVVAGDVFAVLEEEAERHPLILEARGVEEVQLVFKA